MKSFNIGLAAVLLSSVSQSATALDIVFDYSQDKLNFFGSQERRTVLEAAGRYWGSRLNDSLDAVSIPFSNQLLTVEKDSFLIFAGGGDNDDLKDNALAGTISLPFPDNHRGEAGALDEPPTDFGPLGGAIAFDVDALWYVDSDTTTTEDFIGHDLFSISLHEIGHALGFTRIADSWNENLFNISNAN